MVKFCGNCGNIETHHCEGCATTAKPGAAPTNWRPKRGMEQTPDQQAKADDGKLELDLVPTQIVRDIAQVRMYGNKKYGSPDNWKQVELRRYVNAMLRHTLAFVEDYRSVDEESGIEHYKHMACNMAFICEILKGRVKQEELDKIDSFEALYAVVEAHIKEFRKEMEALGDVRV